MASPEAVEDRNHYDAQEERDHFMAVVNAFLYYRLRLHGVIPKENPRKNAIFIY